VNSYRFFLNGENISNQFFLKVIGDQQYAYLLLNFENNHFVDMFLLKEIAGFTD
jgi:hypothetical protein